MSSNLERMSHPRQYSEIDPVAKRFGFVLGKAPSTARTFMYQWREHGILILTAFRDARQQERLHGFFAPLLKELNEPSKEPVTAALLRDTQKIDMAEDIAEAVYQAEPTTENRRAYLEKCKREYAAMGRLIAALESEGE